MSRVRLIVLLITVSTVLLLGQWLYLGDETPGWKSVKNALYDPSPSVDDVKRELKAAEIIRDVIDDFKPQLVLNVTWPTGKTAELGNIITPDDAEDQPTVRLTEFAKSLATDAHTSFSKNTYVIVMTDPDAPSRESPKWGEYCHWIAACVPFASGVDGTDQASPLSDPIWEYKPPRPPPKTGKHRYVFLALTPKEGKSATNLIQPTLRQNWGTGKERHGVRQWAKKNNLIPVAANFVYAQNEDQ